MSILKEHDYAKEGLQDRSEKAYRFPVNSEVYNDNHGNFQEKQTAYDDQVLKLIKDQLRCVYQIKVS